MNDKIIAGGIVVLAVLAVGLSASFAPEKIEINKFSSHQELKSYIDSASPGSFYGGFAMGGSVMRSTGAPMLEATSDAGTTGNDYSTTNIQVAGVDEADIVKTDGDYLYLVAGNGVVIVDASPTDAGIVAEIDIDSQPRELFVHGNRLVIFTDSTYRDGPQPGIPDIVGMPVPRYYSQEMFIKVYDIADRTAPTLLKDFSLDGRYQESRMIGEYVYAVSTHYITGSDVPVPVLREGGVEIEQFPDIYYFPGYPVAETFTTIISVDVNSGESDTNTYLTAASDTLYSSQNNLYLIHPKRVNYQDYQNRIMDVVISYLPPTEAVALQDALNTPEDWEKMQAAQSTVQEYFSSLSSEEKENMNNDIQKQRQVISEEFSRESQKTVIRRFSLSNGNVNHEATGEVVGYVLNQFSMDEHNGYFRIATTTRPSFFGSTGIAVGVTQQVMEVAVEQGVPIADDDEPAREIAPPQNLEKNNVYILGMDLSLVGSLEDLAPGESIFSARFLGDRLYMVTFKKIDPLFVIDLSSPSNPSVLGKLKIPGFSDYLHPYDENHIIGIGKEATPGDGNFAWYQGVKLALFDVSDVTNPKEKAQYVIGDRGTNSEALQDHKAFLFDRERGLLVIPILLAEIDEDSYSGEIPPFAYGEFVWQGAYVFNLDTENGFSLKGKITHVNDDSLEKSGYYYFSPFSVRRSLYIGNVLYTVSGGMVKLNDLESLAELNRVELPFEPQPDFFILSEDTSL